MSDYQNYMLRCIELAKLGAGSVSPNPMVGAVIVHNNQIIGEGFHRSFGGPHAEVDAIHDAFRKLGDNAAELLKQASIFVSLEPCAHFGKTPPCADLIINHQIPNVIVGCRDPFTDVNGRGIEKLKEAGIHVTEGILQEECEFLNRRFFTRVKKQRPYIILKWAETSDGFFAPENKQQKWISGGLSRMLTHRWRTEEDAVLVGKNTALIDNPRLNVRDWKGRNPKRIVIDRFLQLPADLHLFDHSQETIVFNSLKTERSGNLICLELEDFDHYLPQLICYQLYLMDVQSLVVEGGAQTLDLFIKAGLWDEARIFSSTTETWAKGLKAPQIKGQVLETTQVGPDILKVILNTPLTGCE